MPRRGFSNNYLQIYTVSFETVVRDTFLPIFENSGLADSKLSQVKNSLLIPRQKIHKMKVKQKFPNLQYVFREK